MSFLVSREITSRFLREIIYSRFIREIIASFSRFFTEKISYSQGFLEE